MDGVQRRLQACSELFFPDFGLSFEGFSHREEELAVKRAHRPSDLHHQDFSESLESVGKISGLLVQGFAAEREAFVHVDAVVAVADGAVDVAQILFVLLDGCYEPVYDETAGFLCELVHSTSPWGIV